MIKVSVLYPGGAGTTFDMDRVAIQDELDMKQQEPVTLTSRITLRVGHEAVDVIKAKGGDKPRARLIKL